MQRSLEKNQLSPLFASPFLDEKKTFPLRALADKKQEVNTALIQAAMKGDIGKIEALIKAGANVNDGTESEGAPLFAAGSAPDSAAFEYLIRAGADLTATFMGNTLAQQIALYCRWRLNEKETWLIKLAEKNIKLDPAHQAAVLGDVAFFKECELDLMSRQIISPSSHSPPVSSLKSKASSGILPVYLRGKTAGHLVNDHKTTLNGQVKTFSEYEVKGDGDCGFTALGVDRKEAVTLLKRIAASSTEKRNAIINELLQGIDNFKSAHNPGEEVDPAGSMPPDVRNKVSRLFEELTIRRNQCSIQCKKMRKLLDENNIKLSSDGNTDEAVLAAISTNTLPIPLNPALKNEFLRAHEALNAKLGEIQRDSEIFNAYVESYNGHLWLGEQTMRCIAEAKGRGLIIWGINPSTRELQMRLPAIPAREGETTVHVLLKPGHYNFLVEDSIEEKRTLKAGHTLFKKKLEAKEESIFIKDAQGATALHYASANGHVEIGGLLIKTRPTLVSEKRVDGTTALLLAALNGYLKTAEFLLENGASLSEKDNSGANALLLAASKNHLEMVQWLFLKKGVSITEKNIAGKTALDLASGQTKEFLQSYVLDKEAKEAKSLPPAIGRRDALLITAAKKGNLEEVERLLKEGTKEGSPVNVDAYMVGKGTALFASVQTTPTSAVFNYLVQSGADLTITWEGRTLTQQIALYCHWPLKEKEAWLLKLAEKNIKLHPVHQAAILGNVKFFKEKVEAKDDSIFIKGFQGSTALHYASANGSVAIAELLNKARPGLISEKTEEGMTPLILAAFNGHLGTVQWLFELENGAKLSEKCNAGMTALLWAACNDHLKVVQWLLENGASLTEKNIAGKTALDLASGQTKEFLQTYALDLEKPIKERLSVYISAFKQEYKKNNIEEARALSYQSRFKSCKFSFDAHNDLAMFRECLAGVKNDWLVLLLSGTSHDSEGQLLKIAAENAEDLALFLECNYFSFPSGCFIRYDDNVLMPQVYAAVKEGNNEKLKILLPYIPKDALNQYYPGCPPVLFWAIVFGSEESVVHLVNHGAKLDIQLKTDDLDPIFKGFAGYEPLHVAADQGNLKKFVAIAAKQLSSLDKMTVSPWWSFASGKTAWDIALEGGHNDITVYLTQKATRPIQSRHYSVGTQIDQQSMADPREHESDRGSTMSMAIIEREHSRLTADDKKSTPAGIELSHLPAESKPYDVLQPVKTLSLSLPPPAALGTPMLQRKEGSTALAAGGSGAAVPAPAAKEGTTAVLLGTELHPQAIPVTAAKRKKVAEVKKIEPPFSAAIPTIKRPGEETQNSLYTKLEGSVAFSDKQADQPADEAIRIKKAKAVKKKKKKKQDVGQADRTGHDKLTGLPHETKEQERKGLTGTHLGVTFTFEEMKIATDGDCGFNALQTTRDELVTALRTRSSSLESRQELSPEIEEFLRTQSEETMHDLSNDLGEIGRKTDFALLSQARKALLAEGGSFVVSKKLFEAYLSVYRIEKIESKLYLGYCAALLYAKFRFENPINLYIWREPSAGSRVLSCIDHYPKEGDVEANPTIHMVHTANYTHYNVLKVMGKTASSAQSLSAPTYSSTATMTSALSPTPRAAGSSTIAVPTSEAQPMGATAATATPSLASHSTHSFTATIGSSTTSSSDPAAAVTSADNSRRLSTRPAGSSTS